MMEPELPGAASIAERLAVDHVTSALPPAPAIDLTAVFGLPRRVERRRWSVSLLAAATAHGIVLTALVPQTPELTGAGSGELEGIDVEIVSAASIERRPSIDPAAGTGAEAVTYGAAGTASSSVDVAAAASQPDQKREQTPPPPEPTVVTEEMPRPPAPDDVVVSPRKDPEPRAAEPPEQPEPKPSDREETTDPAAPAAADAHQDRGGASAPGVPAPAQAASRGVAASRGSVNAYKKSVVEALAARRPKGKGVRGTVRIAFTISASGEVSEAHIVKPSGQRTLDAAALSAVSTTKFPAPPPELNPPDLHYEIPYYFR